jgi:hypothetical protein
LKKERKVLKKKGSQKKISSRLLERSEVEDEGFFDTNTVKRKQILGPFYNCKLTLTQISKHKKVKIL